jgi:hypothetical protein
MLAWPSAQVPAVLHSDEIYETYPMSRADRVVLSGCAIECGWNEGYSGDREVM